MKRCQRDECIVTFLNDAVAEGVEVGAWQRRSIDDERVEVEVELGQQRRERVVEGRGVEQVEVALRSDESVLPVPVQRCQGEGRSDGKA